MRKISKSKCPDSLLKAPVPLSSNDVQEVICKATDVRDRLINDQFRKCAYCECKINKAYNDVEHFRPKSVYYWLGHSWDNLLYSCELCNRTYKKDKFPLSKSGHSDIANHDISKEIPLIINPVNEDPLDFIEYNRYIMCSKTEGGVVEEKGNTTIELFHLNDRIERPALLEERESIFENYQNIVCIITKMREIMSAHDLPDSILEKCKKVIDLNEKDIKNLSDPSRPYSGMIVYFERNGRYKF